MKTCIPLIILLALVDATVSASPLLNADFEAVLGSEWTAKNSLPPAAASPPSATVTRIPGTRDGGLGS